jgi:flagellar motor switch protein FliN
MRRPTLGVATSFVGPPRSTRGSDRVARGRADAFRSTPRVTRDGSLMADAADPKPGPAGITDADIDALLEEMNKPQPAGGGDAASATTAKSPPSSSSGGQNSESIDASLTNTVSDPSAIRPGAAVDLSLGAIPLDLPDLQRAMGDAQASSIDLLRDVDLNVKIELGRSRMLVEDVLKLAEGSIVELDKLAGDPVDVYVNDRLVARGEVLVLNDSFCVRVNEIVSSTNEAD